MSILNTNKLYNEPVKLLDLVTVLEEKELDYHDEIVPASTLNMSSDGLLTIKNNIGYSEHFVQPQAMELLCQKTRVPHSYVGRLEPWLSALNINNGLEKISTKELMIRFDKNEVRAILTPQYMPVSTLSVMKTVSEYSNKLGHFNPETKFEWTPKKFAAQVIFEKDNTTKSVGTPVASGVCIGQSEVGFSSIYAAAYLMILQCTNGMIVQSTIDSYKKVHRGNGEFPFIEFTERLDSIIKKLPDHLNTFNNTRNIYAPDPMVIIENLGRQFKVTDNITQFVKEGWEQEERGNNLFAVINAFTYAGSNIQSIPLNDRENLQSLASRLLKFTPRQMETLSIPMESAA